MTNQAVTKYVADWFARADEDLDVAQLILEKERPYNPACFHEQQAAEKYLKGFLAYHSKHARKIHDLDALLQSCIKIDQSFEIFRDNTQYLTRFYIESRYPDDYVEFTREDAERGLEAAIRIKDFVLEKIESQKQNGFSMFGIISIVAILIILVAGGYWGYRYQFSELSTPKTPPPKTDQKMPSSTDIDTSNWKTYRNEKYGFEVRYPGEWSVKTSQLGVRTTVEFTDVSKNNSGMFYSDIFSISYGPNQGGETLEQRLADEMQTSRWEKVGVITIGDFPAYKLLLPETDAPPRYIFATSGSGMSYIFDISLRTSDEKVSNQILSTFKFIE